MSSMLNTHALRRQRLQHKGYNNMVYTVSVCLCVCVTLPCVGEGSKSQVVTMEVRHQLHQTLHPPHSAAPRHTQPSSLPELYTHSINISVMISHSNFASYHSVVQVLLYHHWSPSKILGWRPTGHHKKIIGSSQAFFFSFLIMNHS